MTHLLVLALLCAAPDFTGNVIGVSDGDTLTVLNGRTPIKIRLNGIDAPEARQDFGSRAKQLASEPAFGKTVTVQAVDTERYGRIVANVVLPDERLLNHEMAGQGMAWWYRQYAPKDRELAGLEAEARSAKRGLWSQPKPIPPWEWRKGADLPAELAGKVIGNRNSHIYHRPGCPNAAKIAEKYRVEFESEDEASDAGFRAGKDCHR